MTTISRQDLYTKIWQKPMSTVAQEFGLSDRGLAKICEKYAIPRPPRGYWAKLEHGYPVKQIPLPKSAFQPEQLIPLSLTYTSRRSAGTKLLRSETIPDVLVAESLSNAHPITKRCRSLLSQARKDDYGRLRSNPRTPLKVGKTALPRALRILDAILKTSVRSGYTVAFDEDHSKLLIRVNGEQIGLEIDERRQRVELPKPKSTTNWFYTRYEYKATGLLTARLDALGLSDLRRQWKETRTKTLESELGKLVATLPVAAQMIKDDRQAEAIQRERWRIQQQRARRNDKRNKLLVERGKHVEDDAMNWNKAKEVRAYLQAIESTINASARQRRLARWAWRYADHIDPLVDFRFKQLESKKTGYASILFGD